MSVLRRTGFLKHLLGVSHDIAQYAGQADSAPAPRGKSVLPTDCRKRRLFAGYGLPLRLRSKALKPIRASKLQSVDRDAFLQLLLSSRSNSEVVARMLCEFPQEYGLPQGFTVSARTVRRFIRSDFAAYAKRSQPVPIGDAHYEPGAQIDFVLTKFQFAGDDFLTKVPLFEAVFPWSHKAYVRVCPDMKQVSWFRC